MAAIRASLVKSLREETGLPMMECKAALTEADGDAEQAKTILQKKFRGKMASRGARDTGEGRVAIHIAADKMSGAIADVRCETAPVAKTDQFIALANTIAKTIAAQQDSAPSAEAALKLVSAANAGRTLADEVAEAFGLLRENLQLRKARRVQGQYLCGYVHHDGKSGVLLALDAAPNPESVAVDLCHHTTFSSPRAITRADIPAEEIDKVRRLAEEVAQSEGKPAQIVEKIVAGKVRAYCAENALMEQEHVKVSKTKVADVLKEAGVNAVTDLCLFKIG